MEDPSKQYWTKSDFAYAREYQAAYPSLSDHEVTRVVEESRVLIVKAIRAQRESLRRARTVRQYHDR